MRLTKKNGIFTIWVHNSEDDLATLVCTKLAHLADRPLEDPRVSVRVQDIAMSLQTALRPGGILAIWSSKPDKIFGMRLLKLLEATQVLYS